MSTRSRQTSTPADRDARRRERIEQLRQATADLLTSDGWQRWLRTRSRFHRYSLHNTLLIALQRPDATHVAGFRKWLELGRCVRKGEKAIRIFAPVRGRRPQADDGEESDDARAVVGFRLACVFDVSQTDPLPGIQPTPLEPPRASVEGDSHAHLLAPLEQHARSLGYQVRYEPLEGRDGYCSEKRSLIAIEQTLPSNAKVATLVHELAHAHGVDYQSYSRAEAELIVESVAYVVCGSAGLDTGSDSIPYLAGWNGDEALDRISRLTGTIDEIARSIEHALDQTAS